LATNFQDLVAKVKNLVAVAPVLGATLHPVSSKTCFNTEAKVNSEMGYLLTATIEITKSLRPSFK